MYLFADRGRYLFTGMSRFSSLQACEGVLIYRHETVFFLTGMRLCTDEKEHKIFLIYKEIQIGSVAKSYLTNGLLIYGEIFAHFLIYLEALPQL